MQQVHTLCSLLCLLQLHGFVCDNTIIIIILQCIAFIGVYLHQCIVHCVLILCIDLVISCVILLPWTAEMHAIFTIHARMDH